MPSYLSSALEASARRFPIVREVVQLISHSVSPEPWAINYSNTIAITPDPTTVSWLGPGLTEEDLDEPIPLGTYTIESPSPPTTSESSVSLKRKRKGKALKKAFFPSGLSNPPPLPETPCDDNCPDCHMLPLHPFNLYSTEWKYSHRRPDFLPTNVDFDMLVEIYSLHFEQSFRQNNVLRKRFTSHHTIHNLRFFLRDKQDDDMHFLIHFCTKQLLTAIMAGPDTPDSWY